jgi:hypothetical protein
MYPKKTIKIMEGFFLLRSNIYKKCDIFFNSKLISFKSYKITDIAYFYLFVFVRETKPCVYHIYRNEILMHCKVLSVCSKNTIL